MDKNIDAKPKVVKVYEFRSDPIFGIRNENIEKEKRELARKIQ